LANRGYDPVYGARPLKRVIQNELQNKLARQILEGSLEPGQTIEVGLKDDALTFKAKAAKAA